jgi:hypothetical protein
VGAAVEAEQNKARESTEKNGRGRIVAFMGFVPETTLVVVAGAGALEALISVLGCTAATARALRELSDCFPRENSFPEGGRAKPD